MSQTFTQDDVVRYIYQETSAKENLAIEKALLIDNSLADLFYQLSAIVNELDQALLEPSDRCVEKIMKHARSYDLHSV